MPTKLFISYARKDGRERAAALRQELSGAGYSIWQDVISMAGGENWWLQIAEAIESVETMVLIVTPQALTPNSMVRREWVHARRHGTRIMPVVFDAEIFKSPDMPRWLSKADVFIFDKTHKDYEANRERFQQQLKAPYFRKPVPFMAIPLPDQFVRREGLHQHLLGRLLDEKGNPKAAKIAIQGPPGFGKSTLAQDIAFDPNIVESFDDGVLMVELGESGQRTLSSLNAMIGRLSGGNADFKTIEDATKRLYELLEHRDCLLIIDDVWNIAHVEPFLRHGENDHSARLITTRDADIAAQVDDHEPLVIAEMLPEEAVQVLIEWLPEKYRPVPDVPDRLELAELARRLGEWPLLLNIFGGSLKAETVRTRSLTAGLDWINAGLEEEGLTVFDATNETDRNRALTTSMAASLRGFTPDEQQRLFELAIFREEVAVPEEVIKKLWSDAGLKGFKTGKLLRRLAHFYQMRAEAAGGPVVVRLHDAMRVYLRDRLGADAWKSAHAALLMAYNPDDKPWYEIPHDGYLYFHLAYHLKEAGRADELHTLLTGSPDWMRTKAQACVGDGAFISDLELLLVDYHDSLMDAAALIRLTELHTARQVVHARVSRYTDKDLEILVWLDRTQEALGHARPRADVKKRFEGLLAIYKALVARKLPVGELVDELETTTHAFPFDSSRVNALSDLAGTLAQAGAYDRAEMVAGSLVDEWRRVSALSDLASALAHARDYDRAERVARSIVPKAGQALAVITLAVALARVGEYERTERLVSSIASESLQELVLHPLAVALARVGAYDRAKRVADSIASDYSRASALHALASALAQAGEREQAVVTFTQAERVAGNIADDDSRAETLCDLAVALAQTGESEWAGAVFTQAERVAGNIADDDSRAETLSDLAIALVRAGAYDRAERVAGNFTDKYLRMEALRDLAVALAQAKEYDRAERVVGSITDVYRWARPLAVALAQAGEYDRAEQVVRSIVEDDKRGDALSALASALAQAKEYDRAERVARSIADDSWRVSALRDLAVALSQAGEEERTFIVFTEVERAAGGIADKFSRASALRDLAVALAQDGEAEQVATIFTRAEGAAGGIADEFSRASAMRDLAVALAQAGEYDRAERVAGSITDAYSRVSALAEVGAYDWAERMAESIADESRRASALHVLAVALVQAGVYDRAETIIGSIASEYWRASALSALAVALAQAGEKERAAVVFTQAEMAAGSIADADSRASAQSILAAALVQSGEDERAGAVFTQAEWVAGSIADVDEQADALSALAVALAQSREYDRAEMVAGRIADTSRRAYALSKLTIALAQAEEYRRAERVAGSIASESMWALQALASALAQLRAYDHAEIVAGRIADADNRASALHALAAALAKEGQLRKALSVLGMRGIDDYVHFLTQCQKGMVKRFGKSGHSAWQAMLVAALRIIAWERPDWGEIADILERE